MTNNFKRGWFNLIYWNISGWLLWTILFLLSYYPAKKTLQDSLTISSAILICLTLLLGLIQLGLLKKSLKQYQDWKNKHQNNTFDKNQQTKTKKLNWLFIGINTLIYLIILILSFALF